ncbi:GerE family transcriptional regulator [Acidocella aquatica]|uniref:GerE family transcriptional regulator n=1 Tax=Acidocella aquatica TaxID=1922313 RepID=A0ABQ6A9H1_9PROT|nr:LuxR C-terminal-related transcriptional regulator [Acidocella aquatica]GLR66873.1 GerE family transcriptional regulator [Acidocella aquatica]
MNTLIRRTDMVGVERRAMSRPAPRGKALNDAEADNGAGFRQRRVGKFEPPFYGFALVSTPRIVEHITCPFVPKLMTVSAPTGYGKTTFLTRLHREWSERQRLCIWVSLDPCDNDAENVLGLLERAADLCAPEEAAELLPEHEHEAVNRLDIVIKKFVALGNPILFLDNLHFCSDPGLAKIIDTLVFTTGAKLRLVLASSAEIPFDKGRARLELNAVDLGARDLSFDAGAVSDLLSEAGLAQPRPETVELILDKTEGWPAAVRLIQAVMSEEPDSERALRRFTGSDADLAAMLNKRLLAGFDADLVNFLLDLSYLQTFSAELAVAATGHARAAEYIEYLVHRNALILALDRHHTWFRFHALFRDFLLGEAAKKVQAGRRKLLLERAARWCHENGHAEDAANYALAAPAHELAREIMDAHARNIVSDRGDLVTYLGWVGRASELGIEIGVESEFWYAWALAFSRRCVRAQQRALNLEKRLNAMPGNEPGVRELTRRLALLRVMLCVVNDDMEAARRGAVEWLQAEQVRSPIYTVTAALAAATSMLPAQTYPEMRRYIQMAQGAVSHIHGEHSHAWMATTKALLDLEQGNPLAAEQILVAAHKSAVDLIGPETRMVAMLASLKARAICDLGRPDEARQILRLSLAHGTNHGFVDTTRHGLEAAVLLWDGEETGPLGFAALDAIASDGPPRLRRMFVAAMVRRLCLLGDTGRAAELAAQADIDGDMAQEQWQPSEALAISLAKIDLLAAQGRVKIAQKLAEQVLRQVTALDRRREVVELHLTAARLHMLANDPSLAVRSISRAVTLAASRGLVQPFLQHKKTFKDVLQVARLKDLALTLSEQISFFQIVCEKTESVVGQSPMASGAQVCDSEALTRREIEMLIILEAGPSNQQIADQLRVSVQTVKWHLYNLYAKLGVKNRAAALAKARSLKLLVH